jgi:hypothetical protein
VTQRFFVHRRLKNIIVNEIRVEMLSRLTVTIELRNYSRLIETTAPIGFDTSQTKYSYYMQRDNPENMTYEHRVIKIPTTNNKQEINDGVYYLYSTIPQTEVANKRQKQVHIYYTNSPNVLYAYPNTTVKYFVII